MWDCYNVFIMVVRGVHPREAMMHFPPISKNFFRLCGKLSQFYLFRRNFLIFIRQNLWWPFSSHSLQILNFPLFSLFQYISHPISGKLLFPPYFCKFTCFLHTFCVFRFPPSLTMMHLCITQCTYWTPLMVFFVCLHRLHYCYFRACEFSSDFKWSAVVGNHWTGFQHWASLCCHGVSSPSLPLVQKWHFDHCGTVQNLAKGGKPTDHPGGTGWCWNIQVHGREQSGSPLGHTTTWSNRLVEQNTDSIVLYLYIYIALLAVHTNQKRFQCERPREKKVVVMEQFSCEKFSTDTWWVVV